MIKNYKKQGFIDLDAINAQNIINAFIQNGYTVKTIKARGVAYVIELDRIRY